MVERLAPAVYREIVGRALAEDLGSGDVTTRAIVPAGAGARAAMIVRSSCVISGLDIAREVFAQVDERLDVTAARRDGDACKPGEPILRVAGRAASILMAERTALNFVQRLSGIATLARRFVDAAGGALVVLDTRKTTPTLRALEKYAVRCGGATNHRVGLYDGVLIKDNHVRLAGGVAEAVRRVRAAGAPGPIEVEAQSLEQVDEALAAGAEVIMLDNLDDALTRQAIDRIGRRARVEISGGVTIERMRRLAQMGADTVSVGALTHSAPAADLSLELDTDAPAPA
jgi:nicotinate-nucleotide pyrophosphorylase (carboxylating)